MPKEPDKDKPYMLTFRDALGAYSAGPFIYEGDDVWAHHKNRDVKAVGKIIGWKPAAPDHI